MNEDKRINVSRPTIVNLERGKIPPQAIELEEAVLGAVMKFERVIDEIPFVQADFFYRDAHRMIFEAISSLVISREPVDLLTVSQQLRKDGNLEAVGGDFYLIELTQKVSSSSHIDFHSRIIAQRYMQRSLIKLSNEIIEESYDDKADVFNIVDVFYSKIEGVTSFLVPDKIYQLSELTASAIERAVKIYKKEIVPGIKTPISHLTKVTGGWRITELIILAARPGMGKTSFAILCGIEPAREGIPTAFFSLEMSKETLVSRIISSETEINGNMFNSEGISPHEEKIIAEKREEIDALPFFIDDAQVLTINTLSVKAKKLKKEKGIQLIVIDYLQLMTGDKGNGNREQEISAISRGLKKLAKELLIPVIALSQLSRGVETRGGGKRPLLSDLRESGAIEQDADMVVFLYRPEYYGISSWDDYGGISCLGEAEYLVAKNRNGGLVRNRMKFKAEYTKFIDLETEDAFFEEINETKSSGQMDAFKHKEDDNDVPF